MTIEHKAIAGELDQDFGVRGIVSLLAPNGVLNTLQDILIGPGQKIYFAASSGLRSQRYLLGRLNTDGRHDSTFGNDGWVSGQFAGQGSTVHSLGLLPDAKLLLLGSTLADQQPALARFTENGTLDTSFGIDGYVLLKLRAGLTPSNPAAKEPASTLDSAANPCGMEILPDGKILGFVNLFEASMTSLIFRLHPDGSLDTTFNNQGYVEVIHPDQSHGVLKNIKVQDDGKYLGCGSLASSGLFVRYDVDGRPDRSFGQDGFVLISPKDSASRLAFNLMVLQPNQRILGIGHTLGHKLHEMGALISLEPDGSPSIQFNGGQPLFTNLGDSRLTVWYGGALQADGKILVTGVVGTSDGDDTSEDSGDVVVARFIDAAPDTSFNGTGWVQTEVERQWVVGAGLTLQADGKIVVAGNRQGEKGIVLRYYA